MSLSGIGSFFGVGGPGGSRLNSSVLASGDSDANIDQQTGQVAIAIEKYGDANSQLLSAGFNTPSAYDDLDSSTTQAAMYRANDPNDVDAQNIDGYVNNLGEGLFDTDLTSAQSMADRARYSELYSGL